MKSLMLGIVLACVASAAVVKAAQAEILAKVNDRVITSEEFEKKYKDNLRFFRFKAPTKENVLDDMIKIELGVAEAKRMNLEKDPGVQEQMRQVLYQAMIDRVVAPKFKDISITDDEVRAYYKNNPEIRTSHIFVGVRVDATKEEEAKAAEKIKMIQEKLRTSGKSFVDVTREYSEGVAAPLGGDIDWQTKDKLDPVYYDTAKQLKVGAVSGIIRSQFGFHIVKLTGIKTYDETNQADVKRMLFDEKRIHIFDEYIAGLKKKYKVTINRNALK